LKCQRKKGDKKWNYHLKIKSGSLRRRMSNLRYKKN
jgi:hypothetical protein